MADPVEIRVKGLAEFRKSLKVVGNQMPKQLRLIFNEAVDLVVQPARKAVPTKSGKASRSIRAGSTQTKAKIKAGSARVPYYPWLDFGGTTGRGGRAKRQFRKRGRYIYKQYFRQRDSGEFRRVMSRGLERLLKASGLEVD